MPSAMLAKLRALVTGASNEECELCARVITSEHEHLLEPDARRVLCACAACAARLSPSWPRPGARYLKVESRVAALDELQIDEGAWAELQVPASLGFFAVRSRTAEVVATFPGRAGLIETFVPLKAWGALERQFPVLKSLLPDVEGLLFRRVARQRRYLRASIDHCYELASLLRESGVQGVAHDAPAVQVFFDRLERSTGRAHAPRPRP